MQVSGIAMIGDPPLSIKPIEIKECSCSRAVENGEN
jgi:hypothetical protein